MSVRHFQSHIPFHHPSCAAKPVANTRRHHVGRRRLNRNGVSRQRSIAVRRACRAPPACRDRESRFDPLCPPLPIGAWSAPRSRRLVRAVGAGNPTHRSAPPDPTRCSAHPTAAAADRCNKPLANSTRRRSPPDSVSTRSLVRSANRNRSSTVSLRRCSSAPRMPYKCPWCIKFSPTVNLRSTLGD